MWEANSDVVNWFIVEKKVSVMSGEASNQDVNVFGIKWNDATDKFLLNVKSD